MARFHPDDEGENDSTAASGSNIEEDDTNLDENHDHASLEEDSSDDSMDEDSADPTDTAPRNMDGEGNADMESDSTPSDDDGDDEDSESSDSTPSDDDGDEDSESSENSYAELEQVFLEADEEKKEIDSLVWKKCQEIMASKLDLKSYLT